MTQPAPGPVPFTALVERARGCRLCPAMEGRRRVLGPGNGSVGAAVLFVGEAPGRRGAERTGVPFHGDASGQRFERFLAVAGWTRADVFVTNAVLCNPQTADGHNRPPSSAELANCRDHLAATLDVVDPRIVVALGRRALAALHAIAPHGLARTTAVPPGHLLPWAHDRWLAWLLHPSALTQTRRPTEMQLADWCRLRAEADAILARRPAE